MSYKSYAQGGQFATYHIDLPIKAEINEDLRAAGDFTKQMERSQKYREKWASSYLTALNNKSNIERQNRDDNFEFLQNNFKRIYEGEQREFEGRLAEMRRDQAEAANAEPGFMEKLFPLLMQMAPMAIGTIQQMQAEKQEQFNQETTTAGRTLIQHYRELGDPGVNLFTERQRIGVLGGVDRRAAIAETARNSQLSEEITARLLIGDGLHLHATQSISARRVFQDASLEIQAAVAGRPRKGIKNLHSSEFSSLQEQSNEISSELHKLQVERFGGQKAYNDLGEHVREDLDKANGSFKRSITAQQTTEWRKTWAGVQDAINDQDAFDNFANNTVHHLLNDLYEINIKSGIPKEASYAEAVKTVAKNYTFEGGGTSQEWLDRFRKVAEKRGLPNIPERKPGSEDRVWGIVWSKYDELKNAETSAVLATQRAVDAQTKQVIDNTERAMLGSSTAEATEYIQEIVNSSNFQALSPKAQRFLNDYAQNPNKIRQFVQTQNSVEFKTGLTARDQETLAYNAMRADLGTGPAQGDWKTDNTTIRNKLVAQSKIEMQEIIRQNPNMNPAEAFERAINSTWSEMLSSGYVKIIDDGDPTTPITTNWTSGSPELEDYTKSRTLLNQRIRGWVQNGGGSKMPYFEWDSVNSDGILRNAYNDIRMYKQKTGMEPTAAQVVNATGSEYIQTVTNTLRRNGIYKPASQVLNEQGEAWAKKTGQKWEPVKAITEEDLARARGQARRDLEGLKPTSVTAAAQQAHLSGQPYQPSRFSPVRFYNVKEDATGEPGADFTHSGGNVNVSVLPGVIKELNTSYNPNRVGGDGQMGAGWGNHAVVEHIDPTNGKRFEAIYAHLAPEDFDKLQVGQQLEQFEPFARMGDKSDPRHLVGSLTGAHTSWDPYEVGSNDPYHNRKALLNYIRNLGRGNN